MDNEALQESPEVVKAHLEEHIRKVRANQAKRKKVKAKAAQTKPLRGGLTEEESMNMLRSTSVQLIAPTMKAPMNAEALKKLILDDSRTDMIPVHESSFVAVVHQKDDSQVAMMALRDPQTVADFRAVVRRAVSTWENPPAWVIRLSDSLENLQAQYPKKPKADSLTAILEAKGKAQKAIADAANREMKAFREATGLSITSITLEVSAHYCAGSRLADDSVLISCKLEVDSPL